MYCGKHLLLLTRIEVSNPGPIGPLVSYSGPTGILGSDGKQNSLQPGLGGVRIVSNSISSHEQTQLNRVCCFSYIIGSLCF